MVDWRIEWPTADFGDAMVNLRARIELALVVAILAGLLFIFALFLILSWVNLLSYFRFTGRDPEGCGSTTFDLLVILTFVYAHFINYRFIRLFVESILAVRRSRLS